VTSENSSGTRFSASPHRALGGYISRPTNIDKISVVRSVSVVIVIVISGFAVE
jgi:hypothetical protein